MGRNEYDVVFDMPLGFEVEGDCYDACRAVLKKAGKLNRFRGTNGSRLDIKQGTDCIICGMRTDFTCAYSNKDHMIQLPEEVNIGAVTIKFGIRTGNRHNGGTMFEKPVMVIGFDSSWYWYHEYKEAICSNLEKYMGRILNIAFKEYRAYLIANN